MSDGQLRIEVSGPEELARRLNAQPGGLFVEDANPSPPDSFVAIEFVLPSGETLSRVLGKVVEAKNAGMGLELVNLDAMARSIVKGAVTHEQKVSHGSTTLSQGDALSSFFEAPEGPIIGIDLGTTNSCAAIVKDGQVEIIKSSDGYETLPSVLFLSADKKVTVGRKAVEKMMLEPERGIYGSKRFVGRPFASNEVKNYGHFFNWGLAPDKRGQIAAQIGDVTISLEVVAASILAHIRKMAIQALGEDVTRAVVTVPAYFGETQRQAVSQAGSIAGLSVERILNEPTAGAVAYGFGRGLQSTILVYDLGGGTFDASVLKVSGDQMEVLSSDGLPFLGGSDFDDRLTEYVAGRIEKEHGHNLREDTVAMERIRQTSESAKRQLSEVQEVTIDLPYLAQTDGGPLNVQMKIDRSTLEAMTQDLIVRTLEVVQAVLDGAQISAADLDDVIMIGGQSRTPQIRNMLQERFGKQPTRNVHPDHAVALGAALVAGAAYNEAVVELTDVLAASIRVGDADGGSRVLIERGVQLPAEADVVIERPSELATDEHSVGLFRGEEQRVEHNEPLGYIRLTPQNSRLFADGRATLHLRVDGEGLLAATTLSTAGETISLETSLEGAKAGAELSEMGADDVMSFFEG